MKLNDLVNQIRNEGFKLNRARVKVCQEIFMTKLALSPFKDSVIFKGGTIMYQLSKELRRSTDDVDIDFMKLSIENDKLSSFLNSIGLIDSEDEIHFKVVENQIRKLNHEDYEGKRVLLEFSDSSKSTLRLKLDIGIHTQFKVHQNAILFNLITSDKGIELLANPIEQMIVEKTSSFVKFGVLSTRMKDLYDIYYLITNHPYSFEDVVKIVEMYYIESGPYSSLSEYSLKMLGILETSEFITNLVRSENWTQRNIDEIIFTLNQFFLKFNS